MIAPSCPFRLTHPSVRRTGCGSALSALGLGSEGHPAWTYLFRVEFQTQRGGRPRRTALTGRPATSAWRVLSLLFNPSRCLEELRPFGKRLGHGSEQHPAWTNVFRVECQTQGAGRPG
jgi:hypothetical protein